jgi:hypothetical protein
VTDQVVLSVALIILMMVILDWLESRRYRAVSSTFLSRARRDTTRRRARAKRRIA